jgi:two-component system, OmpR family, heavy metal sensor histidine kinase CusS
VRALSITQRVTALWVVLFLLGLSAFAVLASAFVSRATQAALDGRLDAHGELAAGAVDGDTGRVERDFPVMDVGGFALVVYRDGLATQVIGIKPPASALKLAAHLPTRVATTISATPPYRVEVQSVQAMPRYRIATFAWEQPVADEVLRLRRAFFEIGIPVIGFAALAGWFLARRSLAPIDRLSNTAAEVARTSRFSTRFPVVSGDELGRLGATFNQMLERLELSFERERAFIGDVSHELRQPLTSISGEAELGSRGSHSPEDLESGMQRIAERARTLSETLDDLLLLARADAGALGSGRSELSEAVSHAAAEARQQFQRGALRVQVEPEPLLTAMPHHLMVRLFANIIRNAMQAARTEVDVNLRREGKTAVVTVEDDGPGIPDSSHEALFRRFHREETAAKSGTGLGLPIAAAIAQAAGGSIDVGTSARGGAKFTIRVPLSV